MPALRFTPLLCLVAGALMVPAQAPWNFWPCLFAGFSIFYILMSAPATPLKTFLNGWCFGFGYFAGGLWWIANALLVEGNEFRWVFPLAVAGLPAVLALFPAGVSAVITRFFDPKRLSGFTAFVTAMALSEWLRGHVFTGFPWNLYGYAWTGWLAMAQSASIGGAYFLTLLTLFWSALPGFFVIAETTRSRKAVLLAFAALTMAANGAYGHLRLQRHPTAFNTDAAVRLVQANITQEDKWNPEKTAENLAAMVELSAPPAGESESAVTFIIWPETAISLQYLDSAEASAMIRDAMAGYSNEVYLMTGALRREAGDDGTRYFNSLVTLDPDLRTVMSYDKSHLVPFGEYIPLQHVLKLSPFVQFEGFSRGGGPATYALGKAPPFSPLVCYEIIFPGAVVSHGNVIPSYVTAFPEWIVNVTNDAWYGDSPGPRQHFAQAQVRAIEEGLPAARVANTGISGVIDPLGRTVYRIALNRKEAKTVHLPAPLASSTPYARYGDSLFFFLCFAAGLIVFFSRRPLLNREHQR